MIDPDFEATILEADAELQKNGINATTNPAVYQAIVSNIVSGCIVTQIIRIADALEKANDIKMGINS